MISWPDELPPAVWAALTCPHCHQRFQLDDGLTCAAGHRFDLARQRYVSLLGASSRTDTADTAEMVTARANFLASGLYQPIAAEVARACASSSGLIVDIGAGTGNYLAAAIAARSVEPGGGIALDASKYAARYAGRAHPAVLSVVADAWSRLPLADQSAGVVLNIFAPRQMSEFHRVLRPGGRLLSVTPQPDHLVELIDAFGMLTVGEDKAKQVARSATGFDLVEQREVRYQIQPSEDELANLVLMGPAASHVSPQLVRDRAAVWSGREVTVAVTVSHFSAE